MRRGPCPAFGDAEIAHGELNQVDERSEGREVFEGIDAKEECSQTGAASHVQRWDRQFVPFQIQHLSACECVRGLARIRGMRLGITPCYAYLRKHAQMCPPCV